MHRRFATLVVTTLAVSAFGQGQVNFNNYVPGATPPVNAPITTLWDGAGAGSIPGLKAQLCLLVGNTRIPVGDVTTFRSGPPAAQAYINGITVVVPGIDVGQAATFVIRAWDGAFYESSTIYGESHPVTITLGGGTSVPADLVGLKTFHVPPMPEPSTMVLAALGGGLFLMRRWRSKTVQSNASATR